LTPSGNGDKTKVTLIGLQSELSDTSYIPNIQDAHYAGIFQGERTTKNVQLKHYADSRINHENTSNPFFTNLLLNDGNPMYGRFKIAFLKKIFIDRLLQLTDLY
jgi:hypothetical protein